MEEADVITAAVQQDESDTRKSNHRRRRTHGHAEVPGTKRMRRLQASDKVVGIIST